ncbi:hypothetical protein RKD49_005389 [Streptomyces glaucescens]
MTNEQKRAVAAELILAAGSLIENWTERFESRGEQPPCDAAEAAELFGRWLAKLPGEAWDTRLPQI